VTPHRGITRREFVRVSAAAGGGLLVAFTLPGCRPDARDDPPSARLNAWLAVSERGVVTITAPVPEIGQGVRTAIAMVVAGELGADWSAVRIVQADADSVFGPGQRAAGSGAVRYYWEPARIAAARARVALIAVAAERWGVTHDACTSREGRVRERSGDRSIGFGSLAADAANRVPAEGARPALRSVSDLYPVGVPTPGADVARIVTGEVAFGIDMVQPRMGYATILRCPVYGGTIRAVDDSAARAVPGVRRVVRVPAIGPAGRPSVAEGVAVVADSTWAAMRGRAALIAEWDEGPNAGESTDRLHRVCADLVARPARRVHDEGDVDRAFDAAACVVEGTYQVPFLAHVPLEPPNCLAHARADGCTLWVGTQVPQAARSAIAERFGWPQEAVTVHVARVGGGFGRRLAVDFIVEAVELSRIVGGPIQVLWTREDDLAHGFLRPMSHHRLRAALDRNGRLTAWLHRQAGTSRYAFRTGEDPADSEFFATDVPCGAVADYRLEYALCESNLPRGPLRAPGHNGLAFVIQSFVDEVALAAGRDPLAFQLELLEGLGRRPYERQGFPVIDHDRFRAVLAAAGRRLPWNASRPAGVGRGVAGYFSFGSYAAVAAEVTVDRATGAVRVRRAVGAIDCGIPVNPAGIAAQTEGAVMDALGAMLHQEITVEGGRVMQRNFGDYPLLRISEAPRVDVEIVATDHSPMGVGEPPYCPVAPAVANAICDATGVRVRRLPVDTVALRSATAAGGS
jgi:isoquinoline 1-oxidoreductase beta subunit